MNKFELLLSDETRLDILEAFEWYADINHDLSVSLENVIEAGLISIKNDPFLYQKRYKSIRIYFIDRFPYGIHYIIDSSIIRVFGFFHTGRNPKRWTDRL